VGGVKRIAAFVVVVFVCWAAPVRAQSSAQFPVQFDFSNPGAKSLGTGGAFLGTADDSTAAFTNPAGLTSRGKAEFLFEGLFSSTKTSFLFGGRLTGVQTGRGVDTTGQPIYQDDVDRQVRPSYAVVSIPIRVKKWPNASPVMSFYRHELARLENEFFAQGVFQAGNALGVLDNNERELPIGGQRSIRITNYGVSFAAKVRGVSLGGGVAVGRFSLSSDFKRFGFTDRFGLPDRNAVLSTATQHGRETAVSFNLGALWEASSRLRVGGTYRASPRFHFHQQATVVTPAARSEVQGRLSIPDLWGAGVQWKVWDLRQLMLRADYSRIAYSQLRDDLVALFASQLRPPERADRFRLVDGSEFRVGLEQTFNSGWSVRAGLWTDPDHALSYAAGPERDAADEFYSATLPARGVVPHYTIGSGFAATPFAFQAAADFSRRGRIFKATISREF
jgi:long-chain fatty acid transport protein